MITSVIGSGLSLAAFNVTDFLQVLLNPFALITALFYSLSLLMNALIYTFAAYAYSLFPIMCELDFSALAPVLQNIISRIEVFIGIFMLFIVAFNLLQYMVDPDKKAGATSKLITKIIIALILLVSSSFIFGILDELQTALVSRSKDNIAQTVLFGKAIGSNEDDLTVGRRIVYAVFFNMYENQDYGSKYGYDKEYKDLVAGESPLSLIGHLWQTPETYSKVYFHYPFLAEVFGLFLFLLFITFAIDIGVRNITLLFLRILFPIAVIGYVTPKGGEILSKYASTYMSTYVQIFVKTFIIYLLLYIFLWFMEALTSIEGSIFKDMSLDDTTKTILLLLIGIALFMFFTKGLPAIMKNVFGIQTDSSLGGLFGKALGIAAAGASLAAGGIFGAITGGVAGGAKGALKGAVKGIKGGATAGWNAGKQVGAGNIGAAVTGYGKGMYSTYGGITQGNKQYKDKANEKQQTENRAVQDAQNAEQRYNEADASFKHESAILQNMAADDPNRAAQEAKVNALAQQSAVARQDAVDKLRVAQGVVPGYQSAAVKNAVTAESNYMKKQNDYAALSESVQGMDKNSPEYAAKVAEAEVLRQGVVQAKAEATAAAKEAKAFDSTYSSTAVKTAVDAEAVYNEKQSTYEALERSIQGMPDGPERDAKVEEAAALKQEVVKARETATVAAQEAVLWDDTYSSKLLSSNSTTTVDTEFSTAPSDASAPSARVVTATQAKDASNVSAVVEGEKQSGSATSARVVTATVPIEPEKTEVNTVPTGATQVETSFASTEVSSNAKDAKSQFENNSSTVKEQTVVTNQTVINNTSSGNINSPSNNGNDKSENINNSKYEDRKDADSNAVNAENEKLRKSRVEEIREEFGTGIVNMDEEEDDSDDSTDFEVIPPEEKPIVLTAEEELERIIQSDNRAYGQRASNRFRELADNQKMDAVLAMQTANKEAYEGILAIAKKLLKEGYSPQDAYNEARKRYNNGE